MDRPILEFSFVFLQFGLDDVQTLLKVHDLATNGRPGKPDPALEVFKRAGVILTVTAWETFVEDSLKLLFHHRLEGAASPREVLAPFNEAAAKWQQSKNSKKPQSLEKWTGYGWKEVVRQTFAEEIAKLNSPSSTKVKHLFKRYADVNIEENWRWRGMTPERACAKLDRLIALRGALTHSAKRWKSSPVAVKRQNVVEGVELVTRLGNAIRSRFESVKVPL